MTLPEISVVIPTFNRREILAMTLPAVLAQDLPAERREVIVVVDGSTDGTGQLLREPAFAGVRVVEQPNRGLSAARNAGLRAARGRFVLFLDDDMECPPTLLSGHLSAHSLDERLVVEGGIELSPNGDTGFIARWHHEGVARHFEEIRTKRDGRWPWQAVRFANTSAQRSLLIDAGGFDERFRFAHEDLEFGLRLSRTGACYKYVSDLLVRHIYRKSAHDLAGNDARRYGRSYLLLGRTHPEYRRYSPLARLGCDFSLKGRLRVLLTKTPASLDVLLRLPSALPASMSRLPGMRALATRLLEYRWQVGVFRGAREAAGSWEALRREFAMRLPVLMYHHVGPPSTGISPEYSVTPAEFARQMERLAHWGYTPIRTEDWIEWCREGKPLPQKPVLITFDDAYADLVEHALPVLQRRRFPAVVFVVTGLLGKTNEWDEKDESRALRLMSADQIREWAQQRIEFGAHSRTHSDLTSLSPAELEREIAGSASELESILSLRPTAFAYPYGKSNREVRERVSRGFDLSFTVADGLNSFSMASHCLMRRVAVYPRDGMLAFGFAVRIGFRPLDRLRERVRIRTRIGTARRWMLGIAQRRSAGASSS